MLNLFTDFLCCGTKKKLRGNPNDHIIEDGREGKIRTSDFELIICRYRDNVYSRSRQNISIAWVSC